MPLNCANQALRFVRLELMLAALACFGPTPARASPSALERGSDRIVLTESEQAWIKAHPQVRWGFDPNWPPFSSYDSYQRLVGIDFDLTLLVARRAGLQLSIVSGASWAEVYAKAKAAEVDFLSATAKSPERAADFYYTHAYGTFPVVIVTRNQAPFLTTMSDLESLSISEAKDHVITELLKRDLPSARFILTDDAEESLKLVANAGADATVQNLAVACRIIRVNGLTNLKISGVTRYEFPLRFAVRKDEPELVSILDKSLATITPEEQETIYAAHLTPDIGRARDWGMWRRRAFYAACLGIALGIGLLLWNFYLKRQIRARQAAAAKLDRVRKDLERHSRELAVRVREVERLNEEMRAANHDLESFSSSVSHDLRGPLRRISSFAELLLQQAGVFLSRQHVDWLALLVRETKQMDLIIHDLLALARLGRRQLRLQRLNMNHLVKSVIGDFQTQVRARRVVWNVGELGEVHGDGNLLRLALMNLLDNALKYTRQTSLPEITIDVMPSSADGSQVVFYVRDNGIGFDMEDAKRIFDPFERLPQKDEYEGSGIGLANVSRIIQKHHGKIWCEASPGQGATFYFTLPVAPMEGIRVSEGAPEPAVQST